MKHKHYLTLLNKVKIINKLKTIGKHIQRHQ